jgi:hypothetical protein
MFSQTVTNTVFVLTMSTLTVLAAPHTLSQRDGATLRLCTDTNLSGTCTNPNIFAPFDACRKPSQLSFASHRPKNLTA